MIIFLRKKLLEKIKFDMKKRIIQFIFLFFICFSLGFISKSLLYNTIKLYEQDREGLKKNTINKIQYFKNKKLEEHLDKNILTKNEWERFLKLQTKEKKLKKEITSIDFENFFKKEKKLNINKIKSFIKQGYDVNKPNNGILPIVNYFKNIHYFNEKEIDFLIDVGFDLHLAQNQENILKNDLVEIALSKASKQTSFELLKYLESEGINIYNSNYKINLQKIANFSDMHKYKTEYLNKILMHIEDNEKMNIVNDNRDILEFIISENMRNESIEILLKKNLSINQELNTKNVLHYASENNYISILNYQKLIDLGANIDQQSLILETPLMFAVKYNNIEQVEILLKNGANIHLLNEDNKDVFDYLKYVNNQTKKIEIKKLLNKSW